jgi:hypothetical protein
LLNKFELQTVNGCLLGDGHLRKLPKNKNACFTYTSVHLEHIEYVFNIFKDYCNIGVRKCSYLDKRTNKIYSRYYFSTKYLPVFTLLYEKWYRNKVKIIPEDLLLTKQVCLLWYLGDGHKRNDNRIYLCTDSFSKNDIEIILIEQLKSFRAKISMDTGRPRIFIPRFGSSEFLKFLGECPNRCFDYKWMLDNYNRKLCKTHSVDRISSEEIEKIKNYYINDGLSYYKISKIMNRGKTSILRILKRESLYKNTKE